MANGILIVGDTGSGKSTSLVGNEKVGIEGLNPSETFLFNIKGKPLPIRGHFTIYREIDVTKPPTVENGNCLSSTDTQIIIKTINYISSNRKDIKNIIIDDFQYILAEHFMAKALQSGYDKFNVLAKNAYDVLNAGISSRKDLNFIVLTHDDEENGKSKMKLLGKMLEDKVNPIGLFTYALFTTVKTKPNGASEYYFITNRTIDDRGLQIPAKTPPGLFEDILIKNDLGYLVKEIEKYNN